MFDGGVTPFALSAIKYGLFALLFLFVWRSMRWVVRGLTVDPSVGAASPGRRGREAEPPARPQPSTLLVHPHDGRPRTLRLDASMVIGRSPEAELRLDDTFVSSQHARIFGRNGSWYVEDLGSTNGTFVNEQKLLAPAMVQPGDSIRVGQTTMEIRR
ncbi:MAG TPA: FHA domain-containing protein [Actinomycetota bacterium]|nr:FHA domain-containing protein [Actinomycetota bacterium]